MAHEMDDDAARKRELEIENGEPVEAKDEDDEEE